MKRFFTSLVLVGLLSMTVLTVAAADTTEVVTEDDIVRQAENTPPANAWVLFTRNAGTGVFRVGPATPPAGLGSLEFNTPTSADKAYLFNYQHIGTHLNAITSVGYSTYRTSGSVVHPQQVPAINIEVDVNGAADGGYTVLVFEPVYNTNQGSVVEGQWQTWDAYAGGQAIWWSSRPIPGGICAFSCFVTWDTILASNPDAVIIGGFGVNQGSGNPALIAAADELTLGHDGNTVTYDFEPYEVAQSSDDCKNGGWQDFARADGSEFANQGDCIQYVNTGT